MPISETRKMTRTDIGERESRKNYDAHLEDYEYNISRKQEFYLAPVNEITREVLFEMYKDDLISARFFRSLYPRRSSEESELSRKEYRRENQIRETCLSFCLLSAIYLFAMILLHDPQ